MEPPRRARRSCWTSSWRTLISAQELSWGMLQISDATSARLHVMDADAGWFCLRDLDLKKPIYKDTAAYGHFGHGVFSWEVPKVLKFWDPATSCSCPLHLKVFYCKTSMYPPTLHVATCQHLPGNRVIFNIFRCLTGMYCNLVFHAIRISCWCEQSLSKFIDFIV